MKVAGAIEDDIYDGVRYTILSEAKPRPKTDEFAFQEKLAKVEDPMARRMMSLEHHLKKKKRFTPIKPRFRL